AGGPPRPVDRGRGRADYHERGQSHRPAARPPHVPQGNRPGARPSIESRGQGAPASPGQEGGGRPGRAAQNPPRPGGPPPGTRPRRSPRHPPTRPMAWRSFFDPFRPPVVLPRGGDGRAPGDTPGLVVPGAAPQEPDTPPR